MCFHVIHIGKKLNKKYKNYDYPTINITYPCCGVGVGTYYQLFINKF